MSEHNEMLELVRNQTDQIENYYDRIDLDVKFSSELVDEPGKCILRTTLKSPGVVKNLEDIDETAVLLNLAE